MQTTTIKFSKLWSFFSIIGFLIYDLIALLMLTNPYSFFFGLALLYYFGKKTRTVFLWFLGIEPALVIDHEGIIDSSNLISLGRVRWDQIESIKNQKVLFVFNIIAIRLKDPYGFIGKESIFKRLSLIWRQMTKSSMIQLYPMLLAISYKELANIMLRIDLDNPGMLDLSSHLIE